MSDPTTVMNGAVAEAGLSVRIEERGPVGQITLKGDLASKPLIAAVKAAVGVAPPKPLTAAFKGDAGAVWMASDELLLMTGYAGVETVCATLREALSGQHTMVVNASDTRAVFRVSGQGARELMAKGAPLDFSETAFPVGTARRTHFAEIAVGIWRCDAEIWEIVCFQSFARHLFDWMSDASVEGAEVGFF